MSGDPVVATRIWIVFGFRPVLEFVDGCWMASTVRFEF